MLFRVMTFNIQHCQNFLSGKIDFYSVADEIQKYNPDVVGLNEIYGEDENNFFGKQVKILAEKLGYFYYFAPAVSVNSGLYGNALLSRYKILSAETVPVPTPSPKRFPDRYYEPRCLLHAVIDVQGEVNVCVIHFGLNSDEQENAVQTVLLKITDKKCLLMGDFNVFPNDKVLSPIRDRMTDTADSFSSPLLSFPSDHPDCKIDYIFVSPDISVVSADIPADVISDHRPHLAVINLADNQ